MSSILIAYYSWAGSARRLAGKIHDRAGGELFEIIPREPYPGDFDACAAQAKKEIQAGYKPELQTKIESIAAFDTILLGSPNWWSTVAPPAAAFLSSFDFCGKTIAPFCTHGGGGQGHITGDIKKLCPGAKVLNCLAVGGQAAPPEEKILAWLKEAGALLSPSACNGRDAGSKTCGF
jgi:flavodoxin